MSVPTKRRTKSSAGRRSAHHALKKMTLGKCPKCNQAIQPHRACEFCGHYKGREVIKIKEKKAKSKK